MFDLLLAIKYLPAVLNAVVAIEQSVTSELAGATKKQIILDVVSGAVKSLGGVVDPRILNGVSALMDSVVAAMNIAGVFKRKPAPSTVSNPLPNANTGTFGAKIEGIGSI